MTQDQKSVWFDLGAKKFQGWAMAHGAEELLPSDGTPIYICPLCTRGITKDALGRDPVTGADATLTGEDVPPKKSGVGGRKILLTCKKPCNNDQGSSIDSHAVRRERWLDLQASRPVTPIRGEHTFDGITVQGRIWHGGGGFGFECVPEWNDAEVHKAYVKAMMDRSTNRAGATHKFSGRQQLVGSERWRFVDDTADLSWIRAAYLASFAVFGLSHILRPNYREVREWLAAGKHPSEVPRVLRASIEETSRSNAMFIVTEPGPQHGLLLITMGRYMVALPGPEDHRTLGEVADDMAAIVPNGDEETFSGYTIPWPTGPQHAWDPDPPEQRDEQDAF